MIRLRITGARVKTAVDEAASWAARRAGDDVSDVDEATFAEWVSEDHNADAYSRIGEVLTLFHDVDETDTELEAMLEEARAYPYRQQWWKRPALAGGLVAACVAGLVALTPLGNFFSSEVTPEPAPTTSVASTDDAQIPVLEVSKDKADQSTKVGEQRILRLADGTRVTMNTDTKLVVDYSPDRRVVRLLAGQALFDVAHNPQRPFTVVAAGQSVTALGTLFEVRVDPGRVNVMLVEGRVVIDKIGAGGVIPTDAPSTQRTFLSPGQQFSAKAGQQVAVGAVNVESRLLWRSSLVEFDDEPLAAAVAELSRYSARPIVVTDPELGAMRISGIYHTGDPAGFVALVQQMLPLTATETPQGAYELSPKP